MQSQRQSSSDTFLSHNGNDPISYYDPAFYYYARPFSIDSESNPTSKQENNNNHGLVVPNSPTPPLSFFHFPSSPFEETTQVFLEQHHDFLLQFHHQTLPHQDPEPPQPAVVTTTMDLCTKKSDHHQIQRKRPCNKRDRHSKINTARGLRDRRMRLSLEVAKRFFGLQDMLAFDKASKTVEWLLNQARGEINRLVKEKKKQNKSSDDTHHNHNSCSSAASSECEEGVSSLDEVVVMSGDQEQEQEEEKVVVEKVVKRRVKHCRKTSAFDPLAKECRERARERARERTREKILRKAAEEESSKQCRSVEETTNQYLIQLGSWNPFETGDQESGGAKSSSTHTHSVVHHPNSSSLDMIKEQSYHHAKEHDDDDDDDDDSLVILSKWSPSLIFNNSGFSQDHQFAEFQSLGKPWEA